MAEDSAKQLALQLAEETARQYESLVAHSRGFLVDLAQRPEIRGDAAAGTTLCMNLLKSHPEYNNIGVIGPDGTVLFTALGATLSVNLSDRLYFQQALKTRDFSTGEYQIGRITNKRGSRFWLSRARRDRRRAGGCILCAGPGLAGAAAGRGTTAEGFHADP